ncbi:MAG: hypothetical protein DRN66_03285 [Candidatus Nanohalarchaeota archaeon]|nr:MAG: hypothetical protein DRN66_03285 [Candidatus Nanohaloarchaeota archaeon]
MGKIKGWRKVKENIDRIVWQSEKTGAFVFVALTKSPFGTWITADWIIGYDNGIFNVKTLGRKEKKQDALKFAINWMKEHPLQNLRRDFCMELEPTFCDLYELGGVAKNE